MTSAANKAAVKTRKRRAGDGRDPSVGEAAMAAYRRLDIADQVRALLPFCAEWIADSVVVGYSVAEDRRELTPVGHAGADPSAETTFLPVNPERLAEWLPEGATTFVGFGPFEALVENWTGVPPASCVALPLESEEGRCAGLILACLRAAPTNGTVERMRQLGDELRPALSNALKVLALRELVIKDDTASCFNRRHFEEFLPEELSRANRFRAPVSLIFLDMDNLKQVNDRFGHAMGSRSLFELSSLVRSKIRKFDKLFRFGGDEFCIVLPETEWHGALEVAERVRDAINRQAFLEGHIPGGQGVRLSASLGIASFPLHARNQAQLVQRADRAMQQIKKLGKNAIGVAEIAGDD